MKFTQIPIILAFLVPAITALPAAEADQSANPAELASRAVCANNVCIGVNRNKLCNDRVSSQTHNKSLAICFKF